MGEHKTTTSARGQRIARNSLFIYMRMLIIMVVTLYTSRVILEALGITDFGIYNVVFGVVTFLSFITVPLSNAVQRYLNIGLAHGDTVETKKYFNQSISLYLVFIAGMLVLGETVGSWFVLNKLVIPAGRLHAAFIAYQFSLLYAAVNIIQVPYMAVLIAREKMAVYAYMGLVEVFMKLGCVYLLLACPDSQRLGLYSALVAISMVIVTFFYMIYCRRFPETHLFWIWDGKLVRDMGKFISMTIFGSFAWMVGSQGVNILLNIFFGPVVNASRGVAMQVCGTINRMTDSILTAFKPQIIQSYASNEIAYLHALLHKGSVYSFLFMSIISIPVMMNINTVLGIWLKDVPEYAGIFTQLVILDLLVYTLQNPLSLVANATGDLKRSQIKGRLLMIAILPVSYIALKLCPNPVIPFWITVTMSLMFLLYCIYDIHQQIGLSYRAYYKNVVRPIMVVIIPTLALCAMQCLYMKDGILRILTIGFIDVVIALPIIYFCVMGKQEKNYVNKLLRIRRS